MRRKKADKSDVTVPAVDADELRDLPEDDHEEAAASEAPSVGRERARHRPREVDDSRPVFSEDFVRRFGSPGPGASTFGLTKRNDEGDYVVCRADDGEGALISEWPIGWLVEGGVQWVRDRFGAGDYKGSWYGRTSDGHRSSRGRIRAFGIKHEAPASFAARSLAAGFAAAPEPTTPSPMGSFDIFIRMQQMADERAARQQEQFLGLLTRLIPQGAPVAVAPSTGSAALDPDTRARLARLDQIDQQTTIDAAVERAMQEAGFDPDADEEDEEEERRPPATLAEFKRQAGQLFGAEVQNALEEFGPAIREAIPALVRKLKEQAVTQPAANVVELPNGGAR